MTLKSRINDEMKAALLGGNRFEGEVLRGLKAAVLNEEVAKGKRDEGLSDEEIEQVVAKEVKKRHESARLYRDNGREELAEPEEKEAEVLERYLPEQMSEGEVRSLVQEMISQTGAEGPAAMSQVIGGVKKQVGNAVDGRILADIVKSELAKTN